MSSQSTLRDWRPDLPRVIPALPPGETRKKESWITREGATLEEFANSRKAADKAVATVAKGVEEARQATEEQGQLHRQRWSKQTRLTLRLILTRPNTSSHHVPNSDLPQCPYRVLAAILVGSSTNTSGDVGGANP
jgi:hypothetical protein